MSSNGETCYDSIMPLMTNDNIRLYPHDRFVARLFWFVPRWVEPNHLTVLRIILIPIVLFLLWRQSWIASFTVFVFAAITDLLDGSLARTRSQITLWGTIADPTADKMLIASVAVYLILKGLDPWVCFTLVLLELLIIANAIRRQQQGIYVSANNYGKIKMVLQAIGVASLLLAQAVAWMWLTPLALALFLFSFVFAFLSLITYGL